MLLLQYKETLKKDQSDDIVLGFHNKLRLWRVCFHHMRSVSGAQPQTGAIKHNTATHPCTDKLVLKTILRFCEPTSPSSQFPLLWHLLSPSLPQIPCSPTKEKKWRHAPIITRLAPFSSFTSFACLPSQYISFTLLIKHSSTLSFLFTCSACLLLFF